MYYDESSRTFNFITGLALGIVIGAGAALVAAPQSGRRTRKRLRRAVDDVKDVAGEQFDELSDDFRSVVGTKKSRFSF